MTRRQLLAFPAAALLRGGAPALKVISSQPQYYDGWPTLLRRRNGELFAVYSGGRESHVCPYGRVELMRSHDDGETWSFPEVLMDTAIDDRDAGICETAAGTLLVSTFTSLAYEAVKDKPAAWEAVNRRLSPERRKALLGMWLLRSTDGGSTWSVPFRVPVNSPHGPFAADDGRVLYPGKDLWGDGRIGVAESKDDGVGWRWLAPIPTRPGDRFEDYHELHGVDAGSGRLVVQIRNHNAANRGETLQSESTDGGKTWSVPRAIGVWGLPSHLTRLRSGRLLMTYGYRRAPFGNRARWSDDGGRTWSEERMVSDDGVGTDLGYPSTVELGNGDLLTLWYEKLSTSPRAVLRTARWSL